MSWEFRQDIVVERDGDLAILLAHVSYPFEDATAVRDVDIALAYLDQVKAQIGVTDEQLNWLQDSADPFNDSGHGEPSSSPGPQLRWRERRKLRQDLDETSVLTIQQTHLSPEDFTIDGSRVHLDAYGAGLRIVTHRRPQTHEWRVTGAISTLQREFNLSASAALLRESPVHFRTESAFVENFSSKLLEHAGLPVPDVHLQHDAARTRAWIFRSVTASRRSKGRPAELGPRNHSASKDAQDYVAIGLRTLYGNHNPEFGPLPSYDVIGSLPDYTLLLKTPLSTYIDTPGQVYPIDPASQLGSLWQAKPSAQPGELNGQRRKEMLRHLLPPAGADPIQLHGENVFVLDPSKNPSRLGSIGIQPPTVALDEAFEYDARTNDFAAANAYFHCDRLFAMIKAFGMPFANNPMGFGSPVEIIHRAAIHPGECGDGRCVNAQATVVAYYDGNNAAANGVAASRQGMQLRFALADISLNPGTPQEPIVPLGVACDQRWVWHEFSHVLIAGSTDLPEFEFAHSAGDALAAIMSDPHSKLATVAHARGLTYPWTQGPNRRHDRRPEDGWSWSAPEGQAGTYHADLHDISGYVREQILSSTLFMLYRVLGGDAVQADGTFDHVSRRASAEYTTYLIIRAINSLGPASATPAWDATVFAAALMDADAGTLLFQYHGQTRPGGAVWKVIRWAFEQFGLYLKNPAKPNLNGSGDPPAIDVYLDDGRAGSYLPLLTDVTVPLTEVWNRHAPDQQETHQQPEAGQANFIYVRARNRGYQTAPGVQASVFVALDLGGSLTWDPAAWQVLPPASAGADQGIVAASGPTILGPFKWQTPAGIADFAILTALGQQCDPANIDTATGLPCAFGPTPIEQLVPYDNNLGLSRWHTI